MDTIIDKVKNKPDFRSQDIPQLDLYMDQIISLFDTYLEKDKRNPEDKLLTKTMINNYSKAGLIKPIKGKKYTKEQILQMLLVYHLKNSLTMQEIKQVTGPVYETDDSIQELYDTFLQIKEEESLTFLNTLQEILEKHTLTLEKDTDKLVTILYLASMRNQITSIINTIVDEYYEK